MKIKTTLYVLTADAVSIESQDIIEQDGIEYPIGMPHRCAYVNSSIGRELLAAQVPEPYKSSVLAVWGDTPTVSDPVEGGESE